MEKTPADSQSDLKRSAGKTASARVALAAKAEPRGIYAQLIGQGEPIGVALSDARGSTLAAFYMQSGGVGQLRRWNGGGICLPGIGQEETGRLTVPGGKAVRFGDWRGVRFGPVSPAERALVAACIAAGKWVDHIPDDAFDLIHLTGDPSKDLLLSILHNCNPMIPGAPATKLKRHRLI